MLDTRAYLTDWLAAALSALQGSGESAIEESLWLGDQLVELGQDLKRKFGEAAGFLLETDPWISSRFEEVEVEIIRSNGLCEIIRVCPIPMGWSTISRAEL